MRPLSGSGFVSGIVRKRSVHTPILQPLEQRILLSGLPGDFNASGAVDADDIDALFAEITSPSPDLAYDLTGDGTVDDADGSETVSLDGGGSYDPDGGALTAVWYEGGSPIATGLTPNVSLPVGSHTLTLEVTDDNALVDTDTDERPTQER